MRMRTLFIVMVIGCLFSVSAASPLQAVEAPGVADTDQASHMGSCVDAQKLVSDVREYRQFIDTVQPVFAGQRCTNPRVVVGEVRSANLAYEVTVSIDGQAVARFADPVREKMVSRAAQWTAEEMRGRLIAEQATARAHDTPTSRVEMPTRTLAGTGYLRVNAQPWANVWIDGRDTGLTTPIQKMALDAGQHTVTLKNLRFRCEGSYEVVIVPDQTLALVKRLDCAG